MNVKDHYDKHLGNFYAWMIGDFYEKQLAEQRFFSSNQILPSTSKIAIDLGCGHGLQAISLANLGFTVRAIDFNDQLLDELYRQKNKLPIEVIKSDILSFLDKHEEKADVIVCMGDTLTHFESFKDVETFIQRCSMLLVPKGKLILSFRDLTTALEGEQRFISVKSDENKILTCFLEYFPDYVLVHDILFEREKENWKQKISTYPKLKISSERVMEVCAQNKLQMIHHATINRMIYLICERR
jgi:cyclopropane fatty-acyl-phospholipid synthase-like methyltransferase